MPTDPSKYLELVRFLNRQSLNIFNPSEEGVRLIQEKLRQLKEVSDAEVIECAFSHLKSRELKVRQVAREVLSAIVERLTARDYLDLLHGRFSLENWRDPCHYDTCDPLPLANEPDEKPCWSVSGLLTYHYSGYVREAALRQLAACQTGEELPFLLIRLNDWVKKISAIAQAEIQLRMRAEYLPHFIRHMSLVLHLKEFQRRDLRTIVQWFVAQLLEPNHDDLLKQAIGSADSMVRREIVRLALAQEGESRTRVILHGLQSPDPRVRFLCARGLEKVRDREMFLAPLQRLLDDPFIPVRREALIRQAAWFPEKEAQTWRQAITDPSSTIREVARYYLNRMGEKDFAAHYRMIVQRQPDSLPAVCGLAETAEEADLSWLRKKLLHPKSSHRSAGLRGLVTVLREDSVAEVLRGLYDPSSKVNRLAAKLLRLYLSSLDGPELFQAAIRGESLTGRRLATDIIGELSTWPNLPWLLRIVAEADVETAEEAKRVIEKWLDSSGAREFIKPKEGELREIRSALVSARFRLDPKMFQAIEKRMI